MPTYFISTSLSFQFYIISVLKLKEALQMRYLLNDMQFVSNVLLGLHAYTGCDTVCAFYDKGKVKPLKLMIKNKKYISTFVSVGEEGEISASCFNALIELACEQYDHKETDYVRYKLYTLKHVRLEAKAISACSDSLKLHTSRANYRAYILINCLQQHS